MKRSRGLPSSPSLLSHDCLVIHAGMRTGVLVAVHVIRLVVREVRDQLLLRNDSEQLPAEVENVEHAKSQAGRTLKRP